MLPVVLNTCALSHFHRGYYSWTQWPHEYLFLDEAGFNLQKQRKKRLQPLLAKEPSLRFLANVGGNIWRGFSTHAHPIYVIIWDNVCFPRTKQIGAYSPPTTTTSFYSKCLSATFLPFAETLKRRFSHCGDGRFMTKHDREPPKGQLETFGNRSNLAHWNEWKCFQSVLVTQIAIFTFYVNLLFND